MVTTKLPTNAEYDKAMDELRKLNEDLFYDDFKEKIKLLESNLQQLAKGSASEFKKEAENVAGQANLILGQMEAQKQEIRELMEAVESSNKDLLDQAVASIESVSRHVTEFTERVSVSDERNRQFLEQNEEFVTLTRGQIAQTEEKLAAHMVAFQRTELHLEQLRNSYEDMFQKHSESIKSIMVVREEAFVEKVTRQFEEWSAKQSEQGEELQRQIDALIQAQSKQSREMLESISNKMPSKEELAGVEKRNAFKMNLLLSVVAIEAILIGIGFFM
ncbi:hypothetical protein BABA_11711 [Neobacillus bataviensis LMG 21833]|uniref:Uncharacterized protein n=1 Tax=Neobacillus bataviensis LMG 21833 TaxID=1117379 RepID=K6DLB3_9BACI|nr:hypothetical protein [Neobacillus bataviensis]EKN69094.1 hypothetical protein BABA_11711 [Neobacillus bataviensis LMG 21833]